MSFDRARHRARQGQHADQFPGLDLRSAGPGGLSGTGDFRDRDRIQLFGRRATGRPRSQGAIELNRGQVTAMEGGGHRNSRRGHSVRGAGRPRITESNDNVISINFLPYMVIFQITPLGSRTIEKS